MKRFTMALAAALLMLPAAAQAQVPVTQLNISNDGNGRIVAGQSPYNNSGGRFEASISIPGLLTPNPQSILVYCIDFQRQFSPGTTYTNYVAYTFDNFVALNFNNITLNDLNAMVDNALKIDLNVTGGVSDKNLAQNNTWDIFSNIAQGTSASDWSNEWIVLFTPEALRQGGNQTFLAKIPGGFQVPEPSSFALVGAGLVAMVVVSRRRNTIA